MARTIPSRKRTFVEPAAVVTSMSVPRSSIRPPGTVIEREVTPEVKCIAPATRVRTAASLRTSVPSARVRIAPSPKRRRKIAPIVAATRSVAGMGTAAPIVAASAPVAERMRFAPSSR